MAMADAGPVAGQSLSRGWAGAAAKKSPRPPHHPAGKEPAWAATPP
jgi:hypothetical protein